MLLPSAAARQNGGMERGHWNQVLGVASLIPAVIRRRGIEHRANM
jgi:hypothetical protein